MQFRREGPAPVGVLFDSDLGNNIDDVLAMALLYGLGDKRESRLVATTVSKPNLKAAALCDAIGRFYAGAVSGGFNARGRTLPVGLATQGKHPEDTPIITGPLGRVTAEGKPAYEHGIERILDTADPATLLRNALTAQDPQNAVVVVSGPLTAEAGMLALLGVDKLIAERVRCLVIAAGGFPDGEPDPAILDDIEAARKVFASWPTPVVAVGREVGDAIRYPAASIEKDFAWAPSHPVVDAYVAAHPMPYDAPTTAMAAVLYAVHPEENYFQLSEPGTITVSDDGRTHFAPSAEGKHRYLILDPAKTESVLEIYTQMASNKPTPPPPRRRRSQQQQVQQEQQKQQDKPEQPPADPDKP